MGKAFHCGAVCLCRAKVAEWLELLRPDSVIPLKAMQAVLIGYEEHEPEDVNFWFVEARMAVSFFSFFLVLTLNILRVSHLSCCP